MTAIADHVDRGETHTPMLFGRFRTWLVMVAVVVILCGVLFADASGRVCGGCRVSVGEAMRIMTGAPIPSGADAVVMMPAPRRDGDGRISA